MKNNKELYKIKQHYYNEAIKTIELIKDLRQKKRLTQVEIAKTSGILQPNLSKLEKTNIIPRFDTMLAWLDAVGIKVKLEYDEPICYECNCKYNCYGCIFENTNQCDDCIDGSYYDDEDK